MSEWELVEASQIQVGDRIRLGTDWFFVAHTTRPPKLKKGSTVEIGLEGRRALRPMRHDALVEREVRVKREVRH